MTMRIYYRLEKKSASSAMSQLAARKSGLSLANEHHQNDGAAGICSVHFTARDETGPCFWHYE